MRRRNPHSMRPNPGTVIPENHLCVATGVRPFAATPTTVVLASVDMIQLHFVQGECTSQPLGGAMGSHDFWSKLSSYVNPKSQAWVWFLCPRQDLQALHFQWLVESGGFRRRFWYWSDPPVIIDGTLYGKPVRLLGLENWLPAGSIDADMLGANAGDGSEFDPGTGADYKSVAQYQCAELARAVSDLLAFAYREDLGHLKSTVGSQSLQSFRHLNLPEGKISVHANPAALELERSAPLGFPIEMVRGPARSAITVLDVNSLYPYVMGNYPYPRHLLWYSEDISVEDVRRQSANALIIARVTLEDSGARYMVKEDDECKWATGRLQATLAGPDFDRALTRGVIRRVHRAAAYEGAGLFCQWSAWAWALRQRYADGRSPVCKTVAKSLGVALWGRFALQLQRWVAADEIPCPDNEPYGEFWYDAGKGGVKCRAIAGIVDRLETREEPYDSLPSVSAFVAAYARNYMTGLRAIAGEKNVVYQCNDALHVTPDGRAALVGAGLVDAARFGALKIDHEAARAHYLAPNVYQHDGELTVSGIPGVATEVEPGRWEWRSLARLSSAITAQPSVRVPALLRRQTVGE
jgi:hypothetical protein